MNPHEDQTASAGDTRPAPVETPCGTPAQESGGVCDIARVCTWRKNAGAELRVSEVRYRALYENSFDGVLLTEADGRILAANPAACRLLDRTEAQLQTLTRLDLVKPDDARASLLIAEREKTGRYQGDLTLLRADGATFEAEVASAIFATQHGPITSVIIRDVSERKRAEALAKEQAQWLDKVNEAVFVTDLDHRITFWNQGAERLGGWTAAEMVGQHIGVLLERVGISDSQVLAVGGQMIDWRGTVSCRHRNGTPQVVAASTTVLRDERGTPTGRICISADITEHSRLKENYERAQRLESLGMLAAGVAHDFNNILTPVSMGVSMLRARLSQPDDLRLLETIQTCVSRSTALVRQILGFAHGIGGEPRVIQVKHILREVSGLVRETFPRSITLQDNIPSDLWPVMANPTQIHQMLLNLCVNARDAMSAGGCLRLGGRNCVLDEQSAARIAGARKGAWLVLFVEDTGIGIAPELLPRMWEPFFTTKSVGKGTGLGLSTVKGIVETHAGFISVDTTPGRGTAFRVFLPAVDSSLLSPESETAPEAPNGNGEKILVVDDEEEIRGAAKSVLTKAGYGVVLTANGVEALAAIKAKPEQFALVLTDLDMPELDGAKLALALHALRPSLKITAMSGLANMTEGVNTARFTGGSLTKPFTAEALLRAVRQALQGS